MRGVVFANRADAGRRLAAALRDRVGPNAVVLGLPRGGVPVAFQVAEALQAPLDVIVVRKLGVPFQPELGMGAIGEGGTRVLNSAVVRDAQVRESEVAAVEERERVELERRVRRYRGNRPRLDLHGREAVVVDDGIATGSTARAACRVARLLGANRVLLAVPVSAAEALRGLRDEVDDAVCLATPPDFIAIGQFYQDFSQTPDEEVSRLLEMARVGTKSDPPVDRDLEIRVGEAVLGAHLVIGEGARGLVLFAHGSGSSRFSPRNRFVAAALNRRGLGTLLFDLLGEDEEVDRSRVFDIELLAQRLAAVTRELAAMPEATGLRLGYFGASTGAAAALTAAAVTGDLVSAVVSRGGRPDLAAASLGAVRCPTLLIVGGEDVEVMRLNRWAQARLNCPNQLLTIPGATHLFGEPGALEQVAKMASDWFLEHLNAAPPEATG